LKVAGKGRRYVRLSYDISNRTTANAAPYNKPVMKITPVERFETGHTANTSLVELFNHCGTHIDLPNHKIPGDKSLTDCDIAEFVFERPFIVDVKLKDEENLQLKELEKYRADLAQCDLLLIRSGNSRIRSSDLKRYTWKTPGVAADAAVWLVENFPNIKGIGMDFLSFETIGDTSHQSRGHQAVLGRNVKIIEDMNLEGLKNGSLSRVFAFPLFLEGVDSFHATVVGEIIE
jgi:arylformamidase